MFLYLYFISNFVFDNWRYLPCDTTRLNCQLSRTCMLPRGQNFVSRQTLPGSRQSPMNALRFSWFISRICCRNKNTTKSDPGETDQQFTFQWPIAATDCSN